MNRIIPWLCSGSLKPEDCRFSFQLPCKGMCLIYKNSNLQSGATDFSVYISVHTTKFCSQGSTPSHTQEHMCMRVPVPLTWEWLLFHFWPITEIFHSYWMLPWARFVCSNCGAKTPEPHIKLNRVVTGRWRSTVAIRTNLYFFLIYYCPKS